jgi:hypothetical protein
MAALSEFQNVQNDFIWNPQVRVLIILMSTDIETDGIMFICFLQKENKEKSNTSTNTL